VNLLSELHAHQVCKRYVKAATRCSLREVSGGRWALPAIYSTSPSSLPRGSSSTDNFTATTSVPRERVRGHSDGGVTGVQADASRASYWGSGGSAGPPLPS